MRRMTAAVLLTFVLMSSLPWEISALTRSFDQSASAVPWTETSDRPDQQPPPTTDLCFCLCMVCPGSAISDFSSSPEIAVLLSFRQSNVIPSEQSHTSNVHSKLFRPPRSA